MKIFTGVVTSTKMAKTAKVSVVRIMAHPVYKKRVKRMRQYLVHDEMGTQVGQQVRFVASKPYSKMKRWKIIEIVGKKQSVAFRAKKNDVDKKRQDKPEIVESTVPTKKVSVKKVSKKKAAKK